MKIHIWTFAAILLLLSQPLQAQVHISGHLKEADYLQQLFITAVDGTRIPVPIQANGDFDLALPNLPNGFYSLQPFGDLYLRKGTQLQVIHAKTDYDFQGSGSLENQLIRQSRRLIAKFLPWYNNDLRFAAYQLDPPAFLELLQQFEQAATAQLQASPDATFKKQVSQDLHYFALAQLNNYALYYGVDSAKQVAFYKLLDGDRAQAGFGKKIDSAYKAMSNKKLTAAQKKHLDSLLYDSWTMNDGRLFMDAPYYRQAISNKLMHLQYTTYSKEFSSGKNSQLLQMQVAQEQLKNDTIREYFVYKTGSGFMKMSKDQAAIQQVYQELKASLRNPHYLTELEDTQHKLETFATGAPAPDFNFENVDGQPVKLSGLRGKYVYIDVWATWCGPCKAEIPHLSKVEETFKGKNIQFVSLSVDRPADKGKWKNFVQEQQLKGLQVISDNAFDADFVQKFSINAIPRFILIDPQGKILAANADRPSDPKLTAQLHSLLD